MTKQHASRAHQEGGRSPGSGPCQAIGTFLRPHFPVAKLCQESLFSFQPKSSGRQQADLLTSCSTLTLTCRNVTCCAQSCTLRLGLPHSKSQVGLCGLYTPWSVLCSLNSGGKTQKTLIFKHTCVFLCWFVFFAITHPREWELFPTTTFCSSLPRSVR